MRMGRVAILVGVAAVVWATAAATARADGVFIPEAAYPAMPEIPTQRALIVYRDGRETLVVESALRSDSPSVGWILPLPAKPEKIEVADRGLLTTLAVCLGPEVVHDLTEFWTGSLLVLIVILPVAVGVVLKRRWGERFLVAGVWILVLVLIAPMFSMAGMGPGGEVASSGVEVALVQQVGDYEVTVLRAATAAALGRWLEEGGLRPLDEAARAIVDDYVKRGWCFAVARLRREGGGAAVPHPIQVTFPAAEPVYPMRLTALAGSTTQVELFIVADRMAAAEGFRCASADRYHTGSLKSWDGVWQRPPDPSAFVFGLVGDEGGCAIGSEEVVALGWDGCVLTRLEGRLTPAEMGKDVVLGLEALRPHRDVFYSEKGQRGAVATVLLWGAVVFVVMAALACRGLRWPRKGWRWPLGIVVAGTFASAAVAYFAHGVVAVGPAASNLERGLHERTFVDCVQMLGLDRGVSAERLNAVPEELVRHEYVVPGYNDILLWNLYTGGPRRCERSPGNYDVRNIGGKTYFCLYDRWGVGYCAFELAPPSGKAEGEKIENAETPAPDAARP